MMKIEQRRINVTHKYFTVLVDANELVVESGKKLPYSTWIGTISENGDKITVWTPAAYKPRGYRKAAMLILEEAQRQIKDGTWTQHT